MSSKLKFKSMQKKQKNNWYIVQEIEGETTKVKIDKSYRKLALKYHPDKNNNSDDAKVKMQELNEARRDGYDHISTKSGSSGSSDDSWRTANDSVPEQTPKTRKSSGSSKPSKEDWWEKMQEFPDFMGCDSATLRAGDRMNKKVFLSLNLKPKTEREKDIKKFTNLINFAKRVQEDKHSWRDEFTQRVWELNNGLVDCESLTLAETLTLLEYTIKEFKELKDLRTIKEDKKGLDSGWTNYPNHMRNHLQDNISSSFCRIVSLKLVQHMDKILRNSASITFEQKQQFLLQATNSVQNLIELCNNKIISLDKGKNSIVKQSYRKCYKYSYRKEISILQEEQRRFETKINRKTKTKKERFVDENPKHEKINIKDRVINYCDNYCEKLTELNKINDPINTRNPLLVAGISAGVFFATSLCSLLKKR